MNVSRKCRCPFLGAELKVSRSRRQSSNTRRLLELNGSTLQTRTTSTATRERVFVVIVVAAPVKRLRIASCLQPVSVREIFLVMPRSLSVLEVGAVA